MGGSRSLALFNGGWGCGCGGTSSSRLSRTERRQEKGKGRATEMKPRVGGLPSVEKRVLDQK